MSTIGSGFLEYTYYYGGVIYIYNLLQATISNNNIKNVYINSGSSDGDIAHIV